MCIEVFSLFFKFLFSDAGFISVSDSLLMSPEPRVAEADQG